MNIRLSYITDTLGNNYIGVNMYLFKEIEIMENITLR